MHDNHGKSKLEQERISRAQEAIRVAEMFPVKGGNFLPILRGGWLKGLEHKQGKSYPSR